MNTAELSCICKQVRRDIIQGKTEDEIRQAWQEKLEAYKEMRKKYLLYEEGSNAL